jgi:hypothetical protein
LKENKVLKFELSPQNLRIKNVLRNDFVAIDVYAISDIYPNRNNSHFTPNSLRDALPSFYNKPALGAFNVGKNDFKAHEMELRWDNELQQDYFDFTNGRCEVPLGVIRNEDLVEVVELNGQTWVHFTCVLWAKYCYRQVKRLLKDKRKKISVEVEVIESHEDENGVEIIDKFTFDGFSLLGEDVTEAIPNAHLTILDKVNDAFYQKQEKCLSFAYKGLDNNNFDFALNENNIKNKKDSFADDSGEIVDNEKVDEITMEHGEEESQEMTYEEKMALLNSALGENTWASDLDETYVYCFNQEERVAYKAPYSFAEDAEGHVNANVNMDEAVKVVRSWKEFSEENADDVKDEDSKENESVEENKEKCSTDNQETEACEDKKEESAENKEECSEGNKECESDEHPDGCAGCENESDKTVCESADEHKEVPENDDKKKVESAEGRENCAEEDDKDSDEEPDNEDNKENESAEGNKEDECNMSAEEKTENKEEMTSDATVVTPDAHVTIDGSLKGTDVYAVGEENLTADELYAKFNDLQARYDALFAQFTAKQNDEFYAFACSLIDAEEDLTAENNSAIKATFSESCKNGAYSSNEDVQNAVEHSLADALYAQRKMSKAKKAETFSVSINKSQNNGVVEETLTNAQELKNLVQRLRRI